LSRENQTGTLRDVNGMEKKILRSAQLNRAERAKFQSCPCLKQNAIFLNVIVPSVIMLNVMAPRGLSAHLRA